MELNEIVEIDSQVQSCVANVAQNVRLSQKIKYPIQVPMSVLITTQKSFYRCSIIAYIYKKEEDFRVYHMEEVNHDVYLDAYSNQNK